MAAGSSRDSRGLLGSVRSVVCAEISQSVAPKSGPGAGKEEGKVGGGGKCRETALPPMVMSCQAWPPWRVPSPLKLACEVTFQSLAKEVGLRTKGDVGRATDQGDMG